jgi:hypothetical protein
MRNGSTVVTRRSRLRRVVATALSLAACMWSVGTASAHASEFGIVPGSFHVTPSNNLAGAHADLTTSFAFNTEADGKTLPEHARNVRVELPSGFAGTLPAVPECALEAFSASHGSFEPQTCPASTQVGTARLVIFRGPAPEFNPLIVPIYNLVPNEGETAKLGFSAVVANIQVAISVRPGDYGIQAEVRNPVASLGDVDSASITIWGVPANPSHNAERGLICNEESNCQNCNAVECGVGPISAGTPELPYLRNPTSCSESPLTATLRVTSWEQPEAAPREASTNVPPMTGCEHLGFGPTISVQPLNSQIDAPSAYTVRLLQPQNDNPAGVASADLRNSTLTFPEGVALSPAAADGLQACTDAEFAAGTATAPACPPGSTIGTATVETPSLPDKLTGTLYLGGPEHEPITGPPYRTFLALHGDGVEVKLVGSTSPNLATGQLTTSFDNAPELPFSELALELNGGARAPLANPQQCGSFTTTSVLEPWSAPETASAIPSSTFALTGCSAPSTLAPSFNAGTVVPQAGGFSAFTMTLSRRDGEQQIRGVTVHTPAGLLGKIAGVLRCPEPQASSGACPASSQIGTTAVAVGAGPHPLWLTGPVFLTDAFKGAPFGLSVVVPTKAGPFDFGDEVVRAKIEVDRSTGALTVTSDPLPLIKDGVPLRLKTIDVDIDRPNFIFNPTHCSQQSVTGSAAGALADGSPGATAALSAPFAVTGCKNMPFKPTSTVSSPAKTSKNSGAGLNVTVTSGSGQANIGKVKVSLPVQLPARNSTLNQACLAAVFEANPASCPAGSVVGSAKAVTPVLSTALAGPAYLVSHGGAAFPDLVIILQGEGVTLYLDGKTDIHKGIISNTFSALPDAPVTLFALTLPEGPHSALSANGNLCDQKLLMPTEFVGQNGAVLTQNTHIEVEGCSNTLSVVSKSVKGHTLTLSISVPGAGNVKAGGKGLSSASRSSSGRETVVVRLHVKRHGKTKVKVSFSPKSGKKQGKTITVKLGK